MHGYPDYEGDKSGLYLKPEWAAKESTDKTLYGVASNQARGALLTVSYTPTKTFYITNLGSYMVAYTASDGELNNMHLVYVQINAVTIFAFGGNGGGSLNLSPPIRVNAGEGLNINLQNWSNHACNIAVSAKGYEI